MRRRIAALVLAGALLTPTLAQGGADHTSVFQVNGMTCGLCAKAIEKALGDVQGVQRVAQVFSPGITALRQGPRGVMRSHRTSSSVALFIGIAIALDDKVTLSRRPVKHEKLNQSFFANGRQNLYPRKLCG